MTTTQITSAQSTFIDSLLASREIPEALATYITANKATFTTIAASMTIDALKALPWKQRPVAAAVPNVLGNVPISRYAIPALELPFEVRGDLLFVQVREYRRHRQLVRLSGAVGGFNRYRVPAEQTAIIAALLEATPLTYAQKFGEHYGVCGCCGAELTDELSRKLNLGPHCRKRFGL